MAGSAGSGELYVRTSSHAEPSAGVWALPAGTRRTVLRRLIDEELVSLFADRILPFGQRSARAYAQVVAAANGAGNPIDFADAAIAAMALERNYLLATRNVEVFRGTPVKLLNPWS